MSENESKPISTLLASGVGPSALRSRSVATGNDLASVQDWLACYGSNGFVLSCTVTSNEAGNSISSVGLLAYSADDETLYCSQYTGGTSTHSIAPSVTTAGFKFQVGEGVLGVVFGYIEGVEFFFEQKLTIVACGP